MKHLLEVCLAVTFVTGITPSMAAQAQAMGATPMQKGISVQLPVTRNAVSMPDADQPDSLIVSITDDGKVYLGVNPTTPAALAEEIKDNLSNRSGKKLYIKADTRTPYANVEKVLDALRKAGVEALNLLTAQPASSEPATLGSPEGLEVLVGPPSGSKATIVQVLNSGQRLPTLKINNERIPPSALQSKLAQLFLNQSEKVVLVQAEGTLPFTDVAAVTDVCRSTGAKVVLVASGL